MVECCYWLVLLLLQIIVVFQSTSVLCNHNCNANVAQSKSNNSVENTRENILHYYREIVNDESHRNGSRNRVKRYDVSTFRGHPKTREERWHVSFNLNNTNLQLEQTQSLVVLLNKVVDKYLNACIPIILYDANVESSEGIVLQTFFQSLKISFLHGKVDENYTVANQNLLHPYDRRCRSYIIFLSDVVRARDVLGPQTDNRVILIPRSTQWKLQEFLSSKAASDIINLLVIGESLSIDDSKEKPYVLYTHQLYTDGLGSNAPVVLTSWIKGKFSRPHINLFPMKFKKGFAGHRFTVTAIHQPPYVIKKLSTDSVGNIRIDWDGLEIRVLRLMSNRLNFSYEIIEPRSGNELGPTYGVIDLVATRRADIGLAGAFISSERLLRVEMSNQHSTDCAAFITLASKALPRYRAIMGPFQWPVWLAIIATYLFAIFPLTFTDRLTLRHLIGNYSEIENMFWYMFGTFTNSLTFKGEYSWSKSKKSSTRILIGFYWMFSIIITACYTSSIIAFVTLPLFPSTVDSIDDLVSGFYRIGTFAKDGWQYWFTNSSHPQTRKLFKNLELVANIEEGLRNVTSAFFWGYAFLGSRTQLQYIVQNNFSDSSVSKRSALHIGEECLSIFGIAYMFPHDSVYTKRLNEAILRFSSNGLILKISNEIAWDLQRSDTGRLLQGTKHSKFSFADVEERKLNLADTEGMFLLMGIGYLVAVSVLISEIVGGCAKRCRQFARRNSRTKCSSRSDPNALKRPSNASQLDEPPLSSKEKFRKIVFQTFRRNSAQPESTMASNEAQNYRKGHTRSGSISFSTNPSTSFGASQSTINERWVKTNNESDIDAISNHNELVKCDGSANSSNHVTADTGTHQAFTIDTQDASCFKGFTPPPEEEFGEFVEY